MHSSCTRLTPCQACTSLQHLHCLALPPRHLPRLAVLCGCLPRLTTLHLADLLLASPAAVAALAAALAAAPALRDLFLPRLNAPPARLSLRAPSWARHSSATHAC